MKLKFNYIIDLLSNIGNKVALIFNKIIKFVSSLGLNLTLFQIKIISLIILLSFFYIIIKFVNISRRAIKLTILSLIMILILSIIVSF